MTNDTSDITVIYHSRKKFYDYKRDIYWYEFVANISKGDFTDLIPGGFLNIPFTLYYEFGGSHEEALKNLTDKGFTDIVEGDAI